MTKPLRTMDYMDENGTEIGQCFRVEDHQLEILLFDTEDGARGRIICPDRESCVVIYDPSPVDDIHGDCWVTQWWDALQFEALQLSELTLGLKVALEYTGTYDNFSMKPDLSKTDLSKIPFLTRYGMPGYPTEMPQ